MTGSYENLKARLPYESEVNAVGCEAYENLSCPVWMVDYLHDAGLYYGEPYQINPIDGIDGYWTLSTYAAASGTVRAVDFYGYVNTDIVDRDDFYGVRPVINLKL